MPLDAPRLDSTTYDQLVERVRQRIPQYTPEWTDFNASDPGITLIELFAWLTETLLYQVNRVPERNYLKFLDLVGIQREPARPASADLTFTAAEGVTPGPIPEGTQIAAESGTGEPLVFETEAGLDLVPLPLGKVLVYDGSGYRDTSDANEPASAAAYRPLGWVPQEGSALYLGFTPTDPLPPGDRLFPPVLRLRVFAPPAGEELAVRRCDGGSAPPTPPVRLAWEYLPEPGARRWRRLAVHEDGSVAFTRDGYVVIDGPDRIAAAELPDYPRAGVRFWLRCRLAAGRYPSGHEPQIDAVVPNTVRAVNLTTERDEPVGISEGVPDQQFVLRRSPVEPGSLALWVTEDASDPQQWSIRDDLLGSDSLDEHATLDATTGTVRLGDGRHGRIPVAGAEIVARAYRYGGGARGNVRVGAVSRPLASLPGVEVTNHRPATGGQDQQPLDELRQQAPRMLRQADRAVTAEDFATLARRVGGVADAAALASAHPGHPGVEVPGAVTVVVAADTATVPPRPSAELLADVCAALDQARLLTTELFVAEPSFVPLHVEALVHVRPYASPLLVEQKIREALARHLDPLGRSRAGEAQGRAPFGLNLYPTNLFGAILAVEHVVAVPKLAVTVDRTPHDRLADPVVVPPGGLIYGGDHRIDVVPVEER